ncbi:MAG: PilZ domain-containing protein [Candidatus Scalindua sp.]
MIRLKAKQDRIPMYETSEKRKYQRVEKPIIIRFRIRPQKGQATAPSDWDMVGVNDLSARGLFFNSSYNIEIGTVLYLRIGFSTTTAPVKCKGIVTRVKKNPHTSIFGIATAFTDIEEHEKKMIDRFVNATLNSRLTALQFSTA